MQDTLNLVTFPAGSLIELDDPLTGRRHLALVADSGTEFIDYLDGESQPMMLPIFDAFEPAQCDDYKACALSLIGDLDAHSAYSDLLLALCDTPAAADPLTLNRAALWAFQKRDFDPQRATEAGLQASNEAKARLAEISKAASNLVSSGAV